MDTQSTMPFRTDNQIIIDALRKARTYINSVEAWKDIPEPDAPLKRVLEDWTVGGEVEAIDAALLELGIIT